jgi:hypothetical protein
MVSESLQIDQEFLAALQNEDAVGAVIRAHLHIEAGLNEFLQASVSAPDQLPQLSYSHKVALACALGLAKEHAPPLRELGKLRNKFAHELHFEFTLGSVDRLVGSLSVGDRAAVEAAYKATNNTVLGSRSGPLRTLPPRMQFAMVAITLKGMLIVATHCATLASQNTKKAH